MEGSGQPERVQTLVDAGVSVLPLRYVQPPAIRPRPSPLDISCGAGVPVLDLQLFRPDRYDEILSDVSDAGAGWGSFQVINHGIPAQLLDAVRSAGVGFFRGSTLTERMRYSCDPHAAASEGYGSRLLSTDDGVLDWRDYFDHHALPLSRRDPSRWPDSPPTYRETMVEYSDQMKLLAEKLLRVISQSLGLKPEYIEEVIGDVYQNITISYYPPCPQPELALGLQAHSDIGLMTLLIQDDVGGLEIFKDGLWVPVQPISDAIIVILADQIEIISNGRYKSAVHHALVNAQRARLSVAAFHDPSKTTKIVPAPELISDHFPQLYQGVVYGDYLSAWYGLGPDGRRNIESLRLHIISNGRYKSAVHRALVNAQRARLSVAAFHDPSKTTKIVPAPELISDHFPQLYQGVVYGDYLSAWYGLGPDGRRNIESLRLHRE